jgi:hypothetical protein
MQLLDEPLLIGGRKAVKARVGAQHPLLLLHRKIPVAIEPIPQVARRRRAGISVPRTACIG